MSGILVFIVIAVLIVLIAANWVLMEKANMHGWYILIPIYGQYKQAQMAFGDGLIFWIMIGATVVLELLGGVWSGFSLIGSIVSLIYAISFSVSLSHSFGKSGGFTAGMVLLPFIFMPILAFGDAEYQP